MTKKVLSILFIAISFFFIGCGTYTSLQHPEVLEPLQFSAGTGISYLGSYGPLTELQFRMGVIKRIDIGIKMDYGTYEIDGRYQVIKEPYFLTAGFANAGHDLSQSYARIYQPFIIVGQTNWYTGLRLLFSDVTDTKKIQSYYFSYERGKISAYNLFIGGCIKLSEGRILLEINRVSFLADKRSYYIPAIGFQKFL